MSGERAVLVGVRLEGRSIEERFEESLKELDRLAVSAGAEVIAVVTQDRRVPDPRFFLGRGKADELAELAAREHVDLVIVDQELTPAQQANLEDVCGVKVLDRTGLILDIFAQRATTSEGSLQVELAQLKYMLPRLVGRHGELSRLGGGIGTRGPGEKKLEVDRRRVKQRMSRISVELERVRNRRGLYRSARGRAKIPVIALVGYTNAGKSTLIHSLTGAGVACEDRLFSTLDPTTRRLRLPGGSRVLLTDTVGFIRNIPTQLIAAFKSTLEEVLFARLLLHVIDVSHPDHEEQIKVVERVLGEIGAGATPRIDVFNKIDLLAERGVVGRMSRRNPEAAFISARSGAGLGSLRTLLEGALKRDTGVALPVVPWGAAG